MEWLGGLGLANSDEPFNMLTMNPQASRYWGKAYFGLEWHDVGETRTVVDPKTGKETKYTSFRVKWHWLAAKMPDSFASHLTSQTETTLKPRRLVRLETKKDVKSIEGSLAKVIRQPHHLFSAKNARLRDEHGRLIETGRIFTLRVESKDLEKTKGMIQAQWIAVRMAAFSEAGEVAYKLDRECPLDLDICALAHANIVREVAGQPELTRWDE